MDKWTQRGSGWVNEDGSMWLSNRDYQKACEMAEARAEDYEQTEEEEHE